MLGGREGERDFISINMAEIRNKVPSKSTYGNVSVTEKEKGVQASEEAWYKVLIFRAHFMTKVLVKNTQIVGFKVKNVNNVFFFLLD